MNQDQLIAQFLSQSLAEGLVTFDDEGRAAINASDDLVVGIDHLPQTDQVLLYAELGYLGEGPAAEPLVRDMLHDSLELAATSGGTFAVDAETRLVALFARRSATELSQEAFEEWLGDVSESGDLWCQRLRSLRPADADV